MATSSAFLTAISSAVAGAAKRNLVRLLSRGLRRCCRLAHGDLGVRPSIDVLRRGWAAHGDFVAF